MAGGLLVVCVFEASMALLQTDTNLWVIRLLMFATGAGMAFVILPQQAATFATISSADTGRASAIYNTQRQTAAALGVSILATVLTAVAGKTQHPSPSSFHVVFLVDAAIAAIGAVIAVTIRDSDAVSTMRPVRAGAQPVTV
jgi:hypothetical protein